MTASVAAWGQVGINTDSPKSTLDVRAKRNNLGAITDNTQIVGLQAPRLSRAELTALTSAYGVDQKGAIIYITDVSQGNTSSPRDNVDAIGYYFFDGSKWQKLGGTSSAAGDTTNDAWINDSTNNIVKLGTKSDGTSARDAGTDFVAKDNGNAGIGTASPNSYAMLDVTSSNKGILAPRVALASETTDLNSDGDNDVTNQPKGLLVYNTGSGALKYVGYVYWDGTEWKALNGSSSKQGTVTGIDCLSASLEPSSYTANVSYVGTLTVPYSGGNGGYYPAQSITSTGVTGLTARLDPGSFSNGSGVVKYNVTGTPSASTPNLATFAINLGGQSCSANVGKGNKGSVSEYSQVNFENYGSGTGGVGTNGSLATILPGAVNIARVKRLAAGVFRIDFNVPFVDNNYVVAGVVWEGATYAANDIQPQMYAPNYVTVTASSTLSNSIGNDTDVRAVNPTNPSYNLETRQIVMKDVNTYVVKYRTHFYIVEGYNAAPIVGGSLLITR